MFYTGTINNMKLGSIDTNKNVLIVAEIGNNHEGNFSVARDLVIKAAEAGVDAVKFQTFETDLYISRASTERYKLLERFQLSIDEFQQLADLARTLGLLFISTPLDMQSAHKLLPIVDAYKIASGDIDYFDLITFVVGTDKPIIMSSGASTLPEIERAIALVRKKYLNPESMMEKFSLLHCVSCYPASEEDVNLSIIPMLAKNLDVVVGYSDHTLGIEAAVQSVAMGARIVEKHFTLDKNFSEFRDHQLSADPTELSRLVERIRLTEKLMGNAEKRVLSCEQSIRPQIRRTAVAAHRLEVGHILTEKDVLWARAGLGLGTEHKALLMGRSVIKSIDQGYPIEEQDLG